MNTKEMIKQYLVENGYDGLRCPENDCYCEIDDLFACNDIPADCEAGYKMRDEGGYWTIVSGEKKNIHTLYTVYRCKSKDSDDRVGPFHASDYGEETLCGKKIDAHWFISDNTFPGRVTCKKCLKILNERRIAGDAKKWSDSDDNSWVEQSYQSDLRKTFFP